MTRFQKTFLAFLGIIACFLIAGIVWILNPNLKSAWTAPLGPALNLSTLPASSPTGAAAPASPTFTVLPPTYAYLPTVTPPPTFTALPTFTSSPQTCGLSGVTTILAIGTDSRSNSYEYGLADVIRLVRVDFLARKVSVLEFPRDLWVKIPEIADDLHGQDHEKLNQAYLYGNPGFGYWNDPSAGPGLLARTLDVNFGARPDHYVAVNMRTFEQVVDAVGGIDIYLPQDVNGRTKNDPRKSLYFAQGQHHLDGQEALQLARIRNEGVFERADNQNRVLCALRDKLATPAVLPKIPQIIQSFLDNIQTDLSPEQISQFACLGTKIDPSMILFASFPENMFKGTRVYDPVFKSRVFIWDVDFAVLRNYVIQFNAGFWPVADPAASTEKSTPFCPPPGQ
jgi:LCP family protein required for cell wall assembly